MITIARNVRMEFRRGAGSSLEVLYGKVSLTPTLLHTVGTSTVLPAPSTFDLINGVAIATNVAPSPAPVGGQVEWAYTFKITDNFGKTWEYMAGVPDGTTEINFNVLPRYFSTKPPLFGQGPQGVPGEAASIAIGSVGAGPTPAVTNTGTATDAILNFTLAQGPQGPPGTGFAQIAAKPASDIPTTYPMGASVFWNGTTDLGYPFIRGQVVTVRSAWDRASQTIYNTSTATGTRVLTRESEGSTSGAAGWGPFKEYAFDDLASPLLNGLMPALDKAKLDGMTPAANSKTFAALASTYQAGFSVLQVRAADGWPIATTGTVVTQKTAIGNGGVAQWLYSVEGGAPQYRVTDAAGIWGNFQTVATEDSVSARSGYNVKDFGAKGDGIADDFSAIRQAIEVANLTAGKVIFPPGTYYTAYKDPSVEANQLVITGNGVALEGEAAVLENFLIYVKGGYGANLNISATIPAGSKNVGTTSAHGYRVGDYVQLLSCVNAYTPDGGEWQLGSTSPTDGSQPIARYTEIQEVTTVPNNTTVTVAGEIIYPTYKASTSGLNYPISGISSSQVRALYMVKGVTFKGITFRSLSNNNGRGIMVRAAASLTIEGCRFESGSVAGAMFKMTDSYNVRFINCTSRKSLDTISGSSWNTFFVGGGCQAVYFEGCDFSGEAQTIDFTPNNFTSAADIGGAPDGVASMSTMQLFGVYESTFNGCSDGVTSHPATYMFEVANCFFNGGSVGVRARSRASIVRDNTIHTSRGGISLSAFVSDSLVSGNSIVQKVSAKYAGYYIGIAYNATSSEIVSDNAVRNMLITENNIKVTTTNAVNAGIWLTHYDPPTYPLDNATKVRKSEIMIVNNRFWKSSIQVDKWINNTLMQDNVFGGGTDRGYYITTQPESAANQIVGNTFLDGTPTVQTGDVTLTGHGYGTQHRVALQKGTTGLGTTALVHTAKVFGQSGILWDALELGSSGKIRAERAAGTAALDIDAVAVDGTSAVTVNVFNGNTTTGQKLFKVAGRSMADDFQIGFGSRLHGGTGSPEGVVSAPQGSLFLRTDGGAGTSMYVKQTGGSGNTGWVGK